jgi:uncharacterized damage-inducible protein DinB
MFTPEMAKGLSLFLTQALENEVPLTRKVLSAVPDDKLDFKLGEKGRTAKELMWHIVTADIWFLDGIVKLSFGEGGDTPSPSTAGEITQTYAEKVPEGLAKVKAMTGEQLVTPVSFFNIMNLPAVTYLNFMQAHMIHHRGQLSTYLRAMNARVPSIYGGSADEPFQM